VSISEINSSLAVLTPIDLTVPTHPLIDLTQCESLDCDLSTCNTTCRKRQQVTIEELLEEDPSTLPPTHSSPISTEPETPNPLPTRQHHLHCMKGLYVKDFLVPSAGAPISNEHKSPPDLSTYMCKCGPMVDPKHFRVAELLMMSSMSNANKDRHLKGEMVSIIHCITAKL
jgi:hypothetical protein